MNDFHFPKCCGREMRAGTDLGKFIEASCTSCGDSVYIRKPKTPLPRLIDD